MLVRFALLNQVFSYMYHWPLQVNRLRSLGKFILILNKNLYVKMSNWVLLGIINYGMQ